MTDIANNNADYRLVYWPIPGRGEFIRLCLEHAGARWVDTPGGVDEVMGYVEGRAELGDDSPQPLFPPILRDEKEGVVLAQTAAILSYLAPKLGLDGEGAAAQAHVLQHALTGLDLNDEAHNTHHPIAAMLYYEDQKTEALRYAEVFRRERIPKFLNYLETNLARNTASNHTCLVGSSRTYADYVWWQVVDGLLFAFPKRMQTVLASYPHIKNFHQHIKADERIAAYLASERRLPYSDGVFRHYAELDAE
ncbi:hypothetical protein E3P99_03747 [Wallemia hederae]|uniref:Glutathione S-transferase n=1 Tax=Wallemia hederae TaxID=1540922 RepID=A0A4T0FDH5_9BASI|nr:hypothetical protein E3P99_03747 [Wallemia hederae]